MSLCACCGEPATVLLQIADREWGVCLSCVEKGIEIYDGRDPEEKPLLEFRLPPGERRGHAAN